MLTGAAAQARPWVNLLCPRPVLLARAPGRNRAGRRDLGVGGSLFGVELERAARTANQRRTEEKAARPRPDGAIPTSGRARSDAKRNQRLEAHKAFLAARG